MQLALPNAVHQAVEHVEITFFSCGLIVEELDLTLRAMNVRAWERNTGGTGSARSQGRVEIISTAGLGGVVTLHGAGLVSVLLLKDQVSDSDHFEGSEFASSTVYSVLC